MPVEKYGSIVHVARGLAADIRDMALIGQVTHQATRAGYTVVRDSGSVAENPYPTSDDWLEVFVTVKVYRHPA